MSTENCTQYKLLQLAQGAYDLVPNLVNRLLSVFGAAPFK